MLKLDDILHAESFTDLLESFPDGIICVDTNGLIRRVNTKLTQMSGWSREELLSHRIEQRLVPEQYKEQHRRDCHHFLQNPSRRKMGHRPVSLKLQTKQRQVLPVDIELAPLPTEQGTWVIASVRDMSLYHQLRQDLLEKEQKYHHMAYHDPLTKLPNRLYFNDMLTHSLAQNLRTEAVMCLMLIDLDNFKTINDEYGHVVGDGVLKACADKLNDSVRASDFVGRFGGDEFVIIATNLKTTSEVETLTDKIGQLDNKQVKIHGHDILLKFSIGISCNCPDRSLTESTLLQKADQALYAAKNRQNNKHYVIY